MTDEIHRIPSTELDEWGVTGAPSGEALVRAAAGVVDHLAASARAYVANL
jgi:hypothetical protein